MSLSSSPTLEEIRTEIGLSSTASLVDCFSNAVSGGFNASYEGSHDRQSNFGLYVHSVFSINTFWFYFDEYGTCCNSPQYFIVTASMSWYTIVDQSEIANAYVSPTYGNPGNTNVYPFANETNWDNWDHSAQINYYDSINYNYLGQNAMLQYRMNYGCN